MPRQTTIRRLRFSFGSISHIGGGNKQVSLQPVSVEGNTGLNIAAGLAEITLKAVK